MKEDATTVICKSLRTKEDSVWLTPDKKSVITSMLKYKHFFVANFYFRLFLA